MLTISSDFDWSMIRFFENSIESNKALHGNNYRLTVTIQRKTGKSQTISKKTDIAEGMIMDRVAFRELVKEHIVRFFDRSYCYDETKPNSLSIAKILSGQIQQKLVSIGTTPSNENIARICYEKLETVMKHMDISVVSVLINDGYTSAYYSMR